MTSLDLVEPLPLVALPAGRRRAAGVWRPGLLVPAAILVLWVLVAAVPSLFAPFRPNAIGAGAAMVPPNAVHLLGTDQLGRDVLSRVIYGARDALLIAFGSVVVGASVGTLMGMVAGYVGGLVDSVLMRVTDVLLAIPGIVLALAVVTILGQGVPDLMLAIGISEVPVFVRVAYGSTVEIRERLFVLASRASGARPRRVITVHVLPNVVTHILVMLTVDMGAAVLAVAGLSFIGLGPPPPFPQWGTMVADSQQYIPPGWWLAVFPGLAIVVSVVTLNALGDALQRLGGRRQID